MPPLPYANDRFDLVLGFSVFSHLREKAQQIWLQELRRVMTPNGLAVLSTLGEYAFQREMSGATKLKSLGIVERREYYSLKGLLTGRCSRDVYQTREHAKSVVEGL